MGACQRGQQCQSGLCPKAAKTKARTGQWAKTLAMCSGARPSWHGIPRLAFGGSCVASGKQFPSLSLFSQL